MASYTDIIQALNRELNTIVSEYSSYLGKDSKEEKNIVDSTSKNEVDSTEKNVVASKNFVTTAAKNVIRSPFVKRQSMLKSTSLRKGTDKNIEKGDDKASELVQRIEDLFDF